MEGIVSKEQKELKNINSDVYLNFEYKLNKYCLASTLP